MAKLKVKKRKKRGKKRAGKTKLIRLPEIKIPDEFTLSHSSKKCLGGCRRKFLLRYLMRLRPTRVQIPLYIGSIFHDWIVKFYRGIDYEKPLRKFMKAEEKKALAQPGLSPEGEEKLVVGLANMEAILLNYREYYAKDLKHYKVIGGEEDLQFEFPLTDRVKMGGKPDLLVESRKKKEKGRKILWEHKTSSKLDKNYIARLPLDSQVTTYCVGCEHSVGISPTDVMYNVAKKTKLRRRKKETFHGFVKRVMEDYALRPEFYYYREPLIRDLSSQAELMAELRVIAAQLERDFELKGQELILAFWKNDGACATWSGCEYLPICLRGGLFPDMKRDFHVSKHRNPELAGDEEGEDD